MADAAWARMSFALAAAHTIVPQGNATERRLARAVAAAIRNRVPEGNATERAIKNVERAIKNVDACERDVEETSESEEDFVPPVQETKSFLALNGDEIFHHRVDHVLYQYVHNDEVLTPGRVFDEAEGDITVIGRSALYVAGQLVCNHMRLWDLLEVPSTLKRKHKREGMCLANEIVANRYFQIASEKLCVCAWNTTIFLSPRVVVQRILRYWLQCLRMVEHPKHPSRLHVQLRPDRAFELYNTVYLPPPDEAVVARADFACEVAEVCLRSVLCSWRRKIADIHDNMLQRALRKKMVKLARGTLRAYAQKLLPLCCALKEFLSFHTEAFERWREQSGVGKWAHRMNLWLR